MLKLYGILYLLGIITVIPGFVLYILDRFMYNHNNKLVYILAYILLGIGFVICVGIGIIELCVKFKVISSF